MKDLSHFAPNATALTAGESMAAGNTVAYDPDNTAMSAPGSTPVNPLPSTTDTPELDVPETPSKPTTLTRPGSEVPVSSTWKKAGE